MAEAALDGIWDRLAGMGRASAGQAAPDGAARRWSSVVEVRAVGASRPGYVLTPIHPSRRQSGRIGDALSDAFSAYGNVRIAAAPGPAKPLGAGGPR